MDPINTEAKTEAKSRTVLLISRDLSSTIDLILYALGVASSQQKKTQIPTFLETDEPAPLLSRHISFATDFTAGVVDTCIWGNNSLTLLQKFESTSWWEHLGSEGSASACKLTDCGRPGAGGRWSVE
jgi:hypothetical protein